MEEIPMEPKLNVGDIVILPEKTGRGGDYARIIEIRGEGDTTEARLETRDGAKYRLPVFIIERAPENMAETFAQKPSRKQTLARLRSEAVERATVLGLALKRETYADISSSHPLFSELVTVVFNSTPAIVLSAPAEVAMRRTSEMFNFIIPVSENSHDLKANIAVKNSPELGRLQREMNFNVHDNGFTNNFDEVEICSIELAKALGQLGVISERSLHKSRAINDQN